MNYKSGLIAASLALLMLGGCGDDSDNQQTDSAENAQQEGDDRQNNAGDATADPVQVVFGTGGTSGAYYALGGALKSVLEASPLVRNVQVVSTGASVQNIQNIQDGLNQLAIVMSDVAYDAVNGQNQFEGNAADITAIAGLYPNVVQVVALGNSGIDSIEDMAGKRIGVGQVGSGVEASARIALSSAGLEYDDLARVSHTGYADSVTEMSNGNLDAAFFTSGVPNSNITGLMQSRDIKFVNIDGDIARTLMDDYPYYQSYTIPANAAERYNLSEPVNTVAIRNLLIAPASMRDDVAEELARRFDEYLGSGQVAVGALREVGADTLDQDLVLPVHPGAQRYYDSREASAAQNDAEGSDAT
ncbi:TAXI family TRAP transporter solute-binding subunit [Kushneria sp. TE3]|uniref:TAXI family TRAP transporter solute-binding subunit n=1 Tax=Kushneria sp. TE3 TaxID=3449832 RepID=UPI003F6853FE